MKKNSNTGGHHDTLLRPYAEYGSPLLFEDLRNPDALMINYRGGVNFVLNPNSPKYPGGSTLFDGTYYEGPY